MKKTSKLGYFTFCGLFVLASVIPSVGMFIGNKTVNSETSGCVEEKKISSIAEKVKSKKADLNWNNFFKKADSFISVNFAFRDKLISADTFLKKNLFYTSASDRVIIGKDNWIFYSDTVEDFINSPTVSTRGINNIIRNLEQMNDYVTEHGGKLFVTVAPNKNTIYPEYMPLNYIKSKNKSNLDRLTHAIENSPVDYCDLKLMLSAHSDSSDELLYHKRDTHWNNTGALYASDMLMKSLGADFDDYSTVSYSTEKTWQGDLDRMLWPGYELTDYQNNYNIDFTYSYSGRYKSSDDIIINTVNENKSGSLLMFRDSFGAAVIPFISENVSQATYVRALPYPVNMIESNEYDYVILEIVERNIDWLQKEAPVHCAEQTDGAPEALEKCTASLFTSDENKSLFHIYGTTDIPSDTDEAPIYYVTLINKNEETGKTYRAYNCYEADLFGEDKVNDNGYSLYVPYDEIKGEYRAIITAQFSDHVYSSEDEFSY